MTAHAPRLVAAVAACLLAATACGSSDADTSAGADNRLTFTRADGSTFTVTDLRVSCGEDSYEGGKTAVVVASPDEPGSPRVRFEAILDDVADGATYTLPYEDASLYQHPSGALLFVADRPTGNEASSAAEDATGTLRVSSAACEPQPSVAFSIDGVLGSEYGDSKPIRVRGDVAVP